MFHLHPLLYVLASSCIWFKGYRYLCSLNNWPGEWNCRILAAVHAVLLTGLSLFCAYILGPWPFDHPGGRSTLLQELILSLSLGYFIFDLMWCISHKTEGVVMLVHHVASILSILYCVYYRESGTEMVAAIGGAEITNPLLQLRWFLKELGYKYHGIPMTVVEYAFAISFFLVRGIVGSYFLYCVVISSRPSIFVKAGGISIFFISAIFAYAIACYMWKKRIKDYFYIEPDEPTGKTKDVFETPIEETKFVNENATFQCENSKSR